MDMRDIEKAIREAESTGDLPPMPEAPQQVDEPFGGESTEAVSPDVSPAPPVQAGESLTVNFDRPSFDQPQTKEDEIVSLLRDLVEVCRRGFGY